MNKGLIMKYFVLKPSGKDIYGKASRAACEAYAKEIKDHNPELYHDLMQWVNTCRIEVFNSLGSPRPGDTFEGIIGGVEEVSLKNLGVPDGDELFKQRLASEASEVDGPDKIKIPFPKVGMPVVYRDLEGEDYPALVYSVDNNIRSLPVPNVQLLSFSGGEPTVPVLFWTSYGKGPGQWHYIED